VSCVPGEGDRGEHSKGGPKKTAGSLLTRGEREGGRFTGLEGVLERGEGKREPPLLSFGVYDAERGIAKTLGKVWGYGGRGDVHMPGSARFGGRKGLIFTVEGVAIDVKRGKGCDWETRDLKRCLVSRLIESCGRKR